MQASRDLSELLIQLDSVGTEARYFLGVLPVATLPEFDTVIHPDHPVQVDLSVVRQQKQWSVTGHLESMVELICSRCLGEFQLKLMVGIDREYMKGSDPASSTGHWEMEKDLVFLEDGVLSIRQMVVEEVILALPMVPLCRETCAGLCSECGGNRNHASCHCEEQQHEGPFAGLRSLKLP